MRVAIAGGGVGGLTAAIALVRKGIDVEICEQSPALTTVGASLQLGPNALRLMEELGLMSELRRIGVLPDAVEFIRWDDGSRLLRMPMGPDMEDHFGAPQLDFYRPDLHRLLAGALPPGTLRLGARVVGIDQDADGVTVRLADGTTSRADVAVAADGIRSRARQELFGAEDPLFSGTVVYRGVARRDRVSDLHPEHVNYYWLGPYRHGVSYWISSGELLAVNCAVQHAEWSRESWTLEAPVEEGARYFEGWHQPLFERMCACEVFLRGAVFVRQPLEQWSAGRVALLGDAAHAMEPFQAQGAAQAVEDAYVLAECLADGAEDLAGALSRYASIRMARARELQESSRGAAGVFYLPDGEEQRARDAAYAAMPETMPYGPRQPIWEYDVRDAIGKEHTWHV
jgi:salicylate hydroxylase